MAGTPVSDALRSAHQAAGARSDEAGAVRNYGDPAAEYAAARAGAVVVERADRALLRMFGRDPLRMIQGLVTNDVAGAPADRAVYAALLSPKGRMIADLRIIRRADDLLLECARAALPNLTETLKKFVPPLFARFEDVTEAWVGIGVYGARAEELAAAALGAEAVPNAPVEDALAGAGAAWVVRTGYAGGAGFDVLTPATEALATWRALEGAGARPTGLATLEVLRIEAGSPRWGAELTTETIPIEAGLLERAISTGKGCYTGQEVIIRILHRGHVNWHLRGMLLGEVAAPGAGAQLVHPETGRVVARITSACESPAHHQVIALGYARRELVPPVEVCLERTGGARVVVVELPFPLPSLGTAADIGASS